MAIWHRLEKLKHHIPGINLKVSRWCNLSPRDCILGLLLKLLEIKYPPTDVVVRMIYKLKSVGNHLSIMWRRVENFTLVQQYGGYNGTSQILVMFFYSLYPDMLENTLCLSSYMPQEIHSLGQLVLGDYFVICYQVTSWLLVSTFNVAHISIWKNFVKHTPIHKKERLSWKFNW